MLTGKKILLGVTGSIAAYKIPILVRMLLKQGAEVKVIMTPSSREFISALTLSTLSKNPVLSELSNDNSWANHVMLGRWADIMVIAPLSCHSLAKIAGGICDNLLMAVYLSATCKVALAPAMDEDMWHHPSTKYNLQKIASFGNYILPVESGALASGLVGEGRMSEPEAIAEWVNNFFASTLPLKNKKALVTAGPTYEQIDPVRFIGNSSSGKMGIAIAHELQLAGAEVTLILGPSNERVDANIKTIRVRSAAEMYNECIAVFPETDIAVMNAAVADFTPRIVAANKIKKVDGELIISLTKTKDILKELGKVKSAKQLLVGFALETTNEHAYAKEKLSNKNADLIVLNSLNDKGAGFGFDTNKITIYGKDGSVFPFETKSKIAVAKDIVNIIINF